MKKILPLLCLAVALAEVHGAPVASLTEALAGGRLAVNLRLRDEGYAGGDLARWAGTIRAFGARWRETFVYFKHEESGTGPAFARALTDLLAAGAA